MHRAGNRECGFCVTSACKKLSAMKTCWTNWKAGLLMEGSYFWTLNFEECPQKNARLTRKKEAWNNSKIFRRGCQVCLVIFHTVDGSEIWRSPVDMVNILFTCFFTPSKLPSSGCLGFLNHQQHDGFAWWLVQPTRPQRNPLPRNKVWLRPY